jgi:ParB/RepB/Spo0J family partition protein
VVQQRDIEVTFNGKPRRAKNLSAPALIPRRKPRTIFDEVALQELAASIREHGVIQPIIVRPIPLTKWDGYARRYELIAGERRWRASILAERTTIPALVREDASEHGTMIELALIENLHRADLHPLEEAWAFGMMRDELGYSYRQIAERVGRSKGYVENRLKLLDLADDLQQLVLARPDTLMHVTEIAKVPDATARAELIAVVRDNVLPYTETQARVRTLLAPPANTGVTGEVSLRKDSHDRETGGDHGTAATDEVSLRKDCHDREIGGDHGTAATDEVSLRKDSHDRQPASDHATTATGEVSLRKDSHDRESGGDHAASAHERTPPQAARAHDRHEAGEEIPTVDDAAIVTLSARERATLVELGVKLEQWLDDPTQLAPTDWEILAPIALQLRDLLRRLNE